MIDSQGFFFGMDASMGDIDASMGDIDASMGDALHTFRPPEAMAGV